LESPLLSIHLIPPGDFQPLAVRVSKLMDFWEKNGRRMTHVGNERFQRLHIERGDVEEPCEFAYQSTAMCIGDQKVGSHVRAFRELGHRCLGRPNNPMGDVGGRAEIDHVFGAPRDAVPEDQDEEIGMWTCFVKHLFVPEISGAFPIQIPVGGSTEDRGSTSKSRVASPRIDAPCTPMHDAIAGCNQGVNRLSHKIGIGKCSAAGHQNRSRHQSPPYRSAVLLLRV
jgi:hypothetical protein